MPLRAPILAVLLALAAAFAAPAAAQARPPARALLIACERSPEEARRAAVFEGQMRLVPGAVRMQMRFALEASTPERRRWTRVAAPGFGPWVGSAPGTGRYLYTKRVVNLLAPASYRVQVRFRWLDGAGAVVERARRHSDPCQQPDQRADLEVRSLAVEEPDDDDADEQGRYVAFVRNTGRTAAGPSLLSLTVGGVVLPAARVLALAPGEGVYVSVEGPPCRAGAEIVADADAEESVDERDETDNRFTRPCPPESA
jgi:CARDB